MIRIETIKIQEFRGIRDLTLQLRGKNFVVCGPNGSGKSGVVDAIQFALTGEIRRLQGPGTGELHLGEHGPHVESRTDPGRASVELTAIIPHLNKKARIRRTIAKAKEPEMTPSDEDVRETFAELAKHPEITLARREIITLILTEATKRSRDVQTLLQLDRIDVIRATLKTTENKLGNALVAAKERESQASEALGRHLGVAHLTAEAILLAVNSRRGVLRLPEISALTKDTNIAEGLIATEPGPAAPGPGRESALADLLALEEAVEGRLRDETVGPVASILDGLGTLEREPELVGAMKRQGLVQTGLALVDGPSCPLCDAEWDIGKLRAHLAAKLARTGEASVLAERLLHAARQIVSGIQRLGALLNSAERLPEVGNEARNRLQAWSADLHQLAASLDTVEGTVKAKARLVSGWTKPPDGVQQDIREIVARVQTRPEAGGVQEATAFLAVAQERLSDLRQAKRLARQSAVEAQRSRLAYRTYCDVSEELLLKLYGEVEADLCAYYRAINEDEGDFKAKFTPSKGKLDFRVDFHKKGMYPPAAYHSEGHQDGMGVCLYLALLKRVLGKQFALGVLDDVIMSVDSQHRKRFCKLLKEEFPNTQFVITTHDEVWARQMRSAGLVDGRATVAFQAWTVETGPVTNAVAESWEQIDAHLAVGDVGAAAARLRRHLEYVSRELAHSLGAPVPFKADAGYDLGQLLRSVIRQQDQLLKMAARAADSWGQTEASKQVRSLQEQRSATLKAVGAEEWAINKLVHYNEWANLTAGEFKDVVTAYKNLLDQFRCSKCDTWLFVSPAVEPRDLRCDCGAAQLNLVAK